MNGGYDDGYRACPCFWGTEPSSLVQLLCNYIPSFSGLRVLDAGCGEGKNSAFLARNGAIVDAVDVSSVAIQNGRRWWAQNPQIRWRVGDIRELVLPDNFYSVVIAYGLLHCLTSDSAVREVTTRFQRATQVGGYHVLCAFNDRRQELHAHPGFSPCLLPHGSYLTLYSSWEILRASDTDLTETHPHNRVTHTHSMTRILARKGSL